MRSSDRIPSLDGLRAVSFFAVFLSHAGISVIPGGFGVTVFFFLSGFLITTLMRIEFERTQTVHLLSFYLRRILRIWPPFYLVLIGATVLTALHPQIWPLRVSAVAAVIFHVANYWNIYHGSSGMPVGTAVYWSLAVEEHFYLAFPFVYLLMRRLDLSAKAQAGILYSICAVVLLWRGLLVLDFHASSDRTFYATDTRIDSILFGCALAVWNNPVIDEWTSSEHIWRRVIVPAAFAVLVICLVVRGEVFRDTLRYTAQGVALTFIFVAAIRFEGWLVFRVLNTRTLKFIGALSYSLYLIHYVVLLSVAKLYPALSPLEIGCLALTASFLMAWGIYVLIEVPCAKLRRRLLLRASGRRNEVAQAAI